MSLGQPLPVWISVSTKEALTRLTYPYVLQVRARYQIRHADWCLLVPPWCLAQTKRGQQSACTYIIDRRVESFKPNFCPVPWGNLTWELPPEQAGRERASLTLDNAMSPSRPSKLPQIPSTTNARNQLSAYRPNQGMGRYLSAVLSIRVLIVPQHASPSSMHLQTALFDEGLSALSTAYSSVSNNQRPSHNSYLIRNLTVQCLK
ncbi:uncharacterized protein BO72DRAFT_279482 [Aspergillus fijiensis CBS 313.89]|uniref:Uncharacterized protein n=1 Tax=Aspergillus fijiensis CBS 313.89 TaxID=1448319 RepID=A0A8G1RIB5_9EURO|nr:uncharacterized protein BO72DRAFT_279482 [Aspergillus fijiensis CBS 313.89]RAK72295.1 hypothetical protein BO72DRAFT_279482 [Aspergillus fijiensis CBS 313.89]